jgi:putative copper export protein
MMNAAFTVVGWVDLSATATLAGGLVWGALVGERSAAGTRALRAAAATLAVTLVAAFGLTALRMREVSEVRGAALFADLVATRWGRLWLVRCAGLAVLAASTRFGALLVPPWLLIRSFQGHAGAHGTVPALIDWTHLLAASVWIGGLVQVALLPRPVAPATARRMRTLATTAIVVLVPSGVYGVFLHVQRFDMLWTPYGRTLIAKLGVAVPLLALGALNHFRHVPALSRGDAAAATRLSRTAGLEVLVAAVVLLLTALLGVLPMPHVLLPS